ncbi:hypothetical protein ACFL2K_03020, partial [Candidatus Margulisiibacteriota bacterium]
VTIFNRRMKELKAFIKNNKRWPRQSATDNKEKSFCSFIYKSKKKNKYNLESVKQFHDDLGDMRDEKGFTLDDIEKKLLIIRKKKRKKIIKNFSIKKRKIIPFDIRMKELKAFIKKNKRWPRRKVTDKTEKSLSFFIKGSKQENKYNSKNIKKFYDDLGDMRDKKGFTLVDIEKKLLKKRKIKNNSGSNVEKKQKDQVDVPIYDGNNDNFFNFNDNTNAQTPGKGDCALISVLGKLDQTQRLYKAPAQRQLDGNKRSARWIFVNGGIWDGQSVVGLKNAYSHNVEINKLVDKFFTRLTFSFDREAPSAMKNNEEIRGLFNKTKAELNKLDKKYLQMKQEIINEIVSFMEKTIGILDPNMNKNQLEALRELFFVIQEKKNPKPKNPAEINKQWEDLKESIKTKVQNVLDDILKITNLQEMLGLTNFVKRCKELEVKHQEIREDLTQKMFQKYCDSIQDDRSYFLNLEEILLVAEIYQKPMVLFQNGQMIGCSSKSIDPNEFDNIVYVEYDGINHFSRLGQIPKNVTEIVRLHLKDVYEKIDDRPQLITQERKQKHWKKKIIAKRTEIEKKKESPKQDTYELIYNKRNFQNFSYLTKTELRLYHFINQYFENRGHKNNKKINYNTPEIRGLIKAYMKEKKIATLNEFIIDMENLVSNKQRNEDFKNCWAPLKKLKPYIDVNKIPNKILENNNHKRKRKENNEEQKEEHPNKKRKI